MFIGYTYELMKYGKLVGYYNRPWLIDGRGIFISEVSEFKRLYNKKQKTIFVPLKTRIVSDNGVEVIMKRYLDVSKKSDRQISIIKKSCYFV